MKTILCYGDSNTWGYDALKDSRYEWTQRYPGVLSQLLGEQFHVIENGLCGRTTQYESEIEPFVNGKKGAEFAAEVHAPLDYVVIMLGTNDCKDMYYAELEDIQKGIEEIGICFEKKGARIILVVPPPMRGLKKSPFYHEFGKRAESKSMLLKESYYNLAVRKGWRFLDADRVVVPGEFDHIHLEADAHKELAKAIYKIIIKEESL